MAEPTLHDKNQLFLTAAYPAAAAAVRDCETNLTSAVRDEAGMVVDIDVGYGRLYGRPAADFAAEQVINYLKRPSRIAVEAPNLDDLHDPCCHTMATTLAAAAGDTLLPYPPLTGAGVLMVIGIGLGLHIPRLIVETRPRHVVLVEPIAEFFRHSLSALDWQSVFARCAEIDASIDMIVGGDPASIAARIEPLIQRYSETAIDGSYLYLHYQNDVTRSLAGKFHSLAGMSTILKGYYADERLMVANTIANVVVHDFWFVEGALRPPLDAPAFVVGAGPSLDACLDTIAQWQDRAIVITAGSTLQALLSRGIVPDFHVEKENTMPALERLRHIHGRNRTRFGGATFGPIRLVASTTVQAGIGALFEEKFLFLRSGLSSTQLFGAGHLPVDGTSPYSANAALTVAALLGFRDVYLFGCDCGAKDADRHHSGDTAYYTLEDRADLKIAFPQRAPGNFGGEVLTNAHFSWSRWTFEQVITAAGLRVRNCSDGAAIAGAAPLPPDRLALTNPPVDKEAIAETMKMASAHYTPGAYLIDQDVPAVKRHWQQFAAAFGAFLDSHLEQDQTIFEFDRHLREFLEAAAQKSAGITTMVGGSARAMVPIAAYYLNRAPDDAVRASLTAVFRAAYREQIEHILADGSAFMAELEAAPGSALRRAG